VDFSAELILVCDSLAAGGIERVVSTLANEWSRRGRKVSVVTLRDRERFFSLDPAVHHVVVEQQETTTWLSQVLRILRSCLVELKRAKPFLLALLGTTIFLFLSRALYHTRFSCSIAAQSLVLRHALQRIESPVVVAFGTSVNVITLKACKGLGRRVVISERNDPHRLIASWERVWRKYYKRADTVTANTRAALRDMRDVVGETKMAFVPNPLRLSNGNGGGNGHRRVPVPTTSPFVLTVGRLVEDKAQDVLLDAFARAGDELRDWRLAIVGVGNLGESLRARAEALGIARQVEWHGLVADPYALYQAAHIFALPSRVEGTPNALLEAMSCGLAVVVSDGAPGPLELVEDGVTGLVVPVNDPIRLAAALRLLGSDDALRRRLGAAARERVTEYDLPRALATWESVVGLTW
jgi:glycosyltransferase involved in cell wall biosynthesis